MSSEIAIKVENLSKSYQVYQQPHDRLKQFILPKARSFFGFQSKQYFKDFWALKDVSLEIYKGDVVGIVGTNGSGKSTLLKLICGTLSPTQGVVETFGRISALLELGSGFNPEFTGRENVHLNASILGMSNENLEKKFTEIERFADIGDHIDQPVKSYSTGMMVRLAFAVQMHLDPEILIIDEALSVGDQFFQAKCYSAIRALINNGTTVLFVSHSAASVKSLCHRALLLNHGEVVVDGEVSQVFDHYFVLNSQTNNTPSEQNNSEDFPSDEDPLTLTNQECEQIVSNLQPRFEHRFSHRVGTGQAQFTECRVLTESEEAIVVQTGATLNVQAVLVALEDCPYEGEVGLVIATTEGVELFAINSFFQSVNVPSMKAGERRVFDFEFVSPLSSGANYRVDLGYRMPVQGDYVDKVFAASAFSVANRGDKIIPLIFNVLGNINIRSVK